MHLFGGFLKVLQFLVIKTLDPELDPDPHWPKVLDQDPHWNLCGRIHNPLMSDNTNFTIFWLSKPWIWIRRETNADPQPSDELRPKFYNFLIIRTLNPDPHWPKMLDPDLHLYHGPNNYKDIAALTCVNKYKVYTYTVCKVGGEYGVIGGQGASDR